MVARAPNGLEAGSASLAGAQALASGIQTGQVDVVQPIRVGEDVDQCRRCDQTMRCSEAARTLG
jgi:hypothetical protein